MTLFRRFLVIQLLMLWQGGFLFYATFVVPVGTEVLGGSFEQGRITRFVTQSMNLVGAAALAVFLWDLLQARPLQRWQRRTLWICWLIMLVGLVGLFLIHAQLMEIIDFSATKHLDRGRFRTFHRTYLWISTVQWVTALAYAWVLLKCWRERDERFSFGREVK